MVSGEGGEGIIFRQFRWFLFLTVYICLEIQFGGGTAATRAPWLCPCSGLILYIGIHYLYIVYIIIIQGCI